MRLFQQRLSLWAGWLGVAALTGFVLVSPLAGQKPAAPPPASSRPARAPATRPAAGGLRTGIRVHGKWTIVVRNPNGTVAAKREFENTLQFDGVNALPIVLGGYAAPGGWGILLGNAAGTTGPCGGAQFSIVGQATPLEVSGACVILEPSSQYGDFLGPSLGCAGNGTNTNCSSTLRQSLVATGSVTETVSFTGFQTTLTESAVGLQLSGYTGVSQGGSIDTVASLLSLCNATLPSGSTSAPGYPATSLSAVSDASPAACRTGPVSFLTGIGGDSWYVTATSIPGGAIATIAGQTVQVTVVISFS